MPIERRYVLDANVVVSALLLPRSVPRQAFDKASLRGRILMSDAVINEFDDVLRRPSLDKYVSEEDRMHFLVRLLHDCRIVAVSLLVTECRDPKDRKYLELAIEGRATCIVSGDGDLLELNPFRAIPILTPRQFFDADL